MARKLRLLSTKIYTPYRGLIYRVASFECASFIWPVVTAVSKLETVAIPVVPPFVSSTSPGIGSARLINSMWSAWLTYLASEKSTPLYVMFLPEIKGIPVDLSTYLLKLSKMSGKTASGAKLIFGQ